MVTAVEGIVEVIIGSDIDMRERLAMIGGPRDNGSYHSHASRYAGV